MKKKNHLYYKIIIIGSGPAGYTAAIYSARANLYPLLITGLEKGGQLIKTNRIENWPGGFNGLTGIELMDNMEKHANYFKTKIIFDQVTNIDFSSQLFKVYCEEQVYTTHSVIIATGSSPKYLGIPSEKKFFGKGVSTCATCDGYFYKNKEVAIVGGGNTAIEEALYLSNITSTIHLIHRSNNFKCEKILFDRLKEKIKLGKVILYTNYIIENILGSDTNIQSLKITSNNNQKNSIYLDISALFIAIGSIPNTVIFKNIINMKNGYIITKKQLPNSTTQTNIPGIFAAGDVVDYIYKQAITSAASGCMAALDAERYLNSLNLKE